MEEQLKRIIAGQELEGEDSDKELLILGRGQRDKKRKVLSDDGEDDDEAKVWKAEFISAQINQALSIDMRVYI